MLSVSEGKFSKSSVPARKYESLLRFRQMKTLQKFASVHANVHNHFNSERHLIDRPNKLMA